MIPNSRGGTGLPRQNSDFRARSKSRPDESLENEDDMNGETNDSRYETTDLYFAAYLQVAGATMESTAKHGTRVSFVFSSDVVNIKELRSAWYNHTGKVPALAYANTIKNLKHLCHMP